MRICYIIKVVLVILFASCGKGQTEEFTDKLLREIHQKQELDEILWVLKNEDSLFEIKYFCEKTDGIFSTKRPYCKCSRDEQFVGIGVPGCYRFKEVNLNLEGKNRIFSKSDHKDAYPVDLTFINSSPNKNFQSVLWKPYIHVPKVISLFDLKVEDVKQLIGFDQVSAVTDHLTTYKDVYNVSLKRIGNRVFKEDLYEQIKFHLNRDFILEQSDFDFLNLLPWMQINYHPTKCLIHCEFEKKYESNFGILKWIRILKGGQHYKEWIEIRRKDNYFNDYMIFLAEKGERFEVSGVIQINVNQNYGSVQNEVVVFQNGRSRKFAWPLLENLAHKDSIKSKELSKSKTNKKTKILLCDSNISVEEISKENKQKIAFLKSRSSRSYYGILNNKSDSFDYLDNINANRNGVLHTSGSGHAVSLLKYVEKASVIPMALFPCLSLIDQWAINASVEGVRVVNLSVADEIYDTHACRKKEYTKKIEKYGEGFLWVMSADNRPQEISPHKSSSCPQKYLYHKKNVLIVSHPEMEFGAKFVDVIISRNQFGNASSTSESTIILSQISNELFSLYPKATPELVKKALILGADFDFSVAYKSRSGGRLNLKRTKKILESLIHSPYTSNINIVKKHFGIFDNRRGKLEHIREYFRD